MSRVSYELRAEIANAVRTARARAGLSRAQAASLCNVTPLIFHLVERGEAPALDAYIPFLARILDSADSVP